VEQAEGGFTYLTAGIGPTGVGAVPVTERVRWQLQQEYGGRAGPLPVVAISDGAPAIRCQLEEIFGQPVTLILDWYHLEKKVWELMSMMARHKTEKEHHVHGLLALGGVDAPRPP